MTGRELLARHMSEEQLTDNTVELATTLGVLVHHCRPAWTKKGYRTPIQGARGFPDLVLARGRVIFRENKSETGKLDADQEWWRDVLLGCGEDWAIWRPSDWLSGAIRAEMEALAKGGDH